MRKEPPDTCCVSNTGENMRVPHVLKGMPRCAVPKLGCFCIPWKYREVWVGGWSPEIIQVLAVFDVVVNRFCSRSMCKYQSWPP